MPTEITVWQDFRGGWHVTKEAALGVEASYLREEQEDKVRAGLYEQLHANTSLDSDECAEVTRFLCKYYDIASFDKERVIMAIKNCAKRPLGNGMCGCGDGVCELGEIEKLKTLVVSLRKVVERYEDSAGRLWKTAEEADAAEAGYILDEQIRRHKQELVANLRRATILGTRDLGQMADFLFKHYDIHPRK